MIYQFVIVVRVQVLDVWYSVGQIENILNREIVPVNQLSARHDSLVQLLTLVISWLFGILL